MSENATHSLDELDRVKLKRAVACDAPEPLPTGSAGTIVAILEEDSAFLVEFTTPFEALVEVVGQDLEVGSQEWEAVRGESHRELSAGRMGRRAS